MWRARSRSSYCPAPESVTDIHDDQVTVPAGESVPLADGLCVQCDDDGTIELDVRFVEDDRELLEVRASRTVSIQQNDATAGQRSSCFRSAISMDMVSHVGCGGAPSEELVSWRPSRRSTPKYGYESHGNLVALFVDISLSAASTTGNGWYSTQNQKSIVPTGEKMVVCLDESAENGLSLMLGE